MKYLTPVYILLLLSCADNTSAKSGWHCWKPGSDLHDGPCVEECMEPGDPRAYCWCEHGCFGVEEGNG
jgi:hypothetical protein